MTLPTNKTIKDLVNMLKEAGYEKCSAQKINKDIEDGAPVNADGTIDVLEYGAWIARFG